MKDMTEPQSQSLVRLTILKINENEFEDFCDPFEEKCIYSINGIDMIEYLFGYKNFGELDCENKLKEKLIPYDKYWLINNEGIGAIDYYRIRDNGKPIATTIPQDVDIMSDFFMTRSVNIDNGEASKTMFTSTHVMSWKEQKNIIIESSTQYL